MSTHQFTPYYQLAAGTCMILLILLSCYGMYLLRHISFAAYELALDVKRLNRSLSQQIMVNVDVSDSIRPLLDRAQSERIRLSHELGIYAKTSAQAAEVSRLINEGGGSLEALVAALEEYNLRAAKEQRSDTLC